MKDPFERTKVVVRRLPPAISQPALMEQIDAKFAGRYKWVCFRPGKSSQKNLRFSRAYIDFQTPEDVVEFAEFFDGHLFVNEKGVQYKAAVEYAPSQRVPKPSKKDGREGTIFKDPEYMSFLEHLSKPAENLPSAEIQLERKEAEKAGALKEVLIVTPLMEFIRQKRASKSSSQKSSANGKSSRRSGGTGSGGSLSSKRSSEKKKQSAPVYVLRDSAKGKDKPRTILVPRRDESAIKDVSNDETGAVVTLESGKKKLILLKGKDREISNASSPVSNTSRQSQRHSGSSKIIKSILSKEAKQVINNAEQPVQSSNLEKEKRPPRHPNSRGQSSLVLDPSASSAEKKIDVNLDGRGSVSGRGSQKHMGRRGQAHGSKEADNSSTYSEPKASSKRGPVGFGSQEKQVWVQKSGSAS
ncbi:smg-4/UPF3 family protein isoform X2 [Wolffia australiana]